MGLFKVKSEVFVYYNDFNRLGECQCDIILNADADRWMVIFTELLRNPGPSVTNAIEYIVEQFCKCNNIHSNEVDFIERSYTDPESFDAIEINSEVITWHHISKEKTRLILKALK